MLPHASFTIARSDLLSQFVKPVAIATVLKLCLI